MARAVHALLVYTLQGAGGALVERGRPCLLRLAVCCSGARACCVGLA